MQADHSGRGDHFWVDWANECVWCRGEAVRLTPKAFAVLRTLMAQAGQLVTKADLLQTVWPETVVSEAVLTGCIGELRKAFGETARAPQYIQTVHRRGYRFIGPAQSPAPGSWGTRPAGERSLAPPQSALTPPGAPAQQGTSPQATAVVVGREAELAQLQQWLGQARRGRRQVVFVTGEAGIGKTTVVHAFATQVTAVGGVWLAQGQCLEQYGVGEPYLPILEALGRLGRTPAREHLLAVLQQQAPTWLVQMPALLSAEALETVQRKALGATRERMLREMAHALETFTRDHPLVLVLEDLHWSDSATLDLLSYLARRPEPARLLLLGTYRPVELIVHQHPLKALKQDLEIHRQCAEISLELLSIPEVGQYLAARFAAVVPLTTPVQDLARTLHQRTDGNPLFLVAVVDDLVRQGVVGAAGESKELQIEGAAALRAIPENLRRMIAQQCDDLSPQEQQLLEAASVAGSTCCAAAIAAGLEAESEEVEARCASLAQRQQFLEASGLEHWPDGTVAERYQWRHTLYQEVVYDRLPAGRRLRLHRRIGARLETGYGAQADSHAAALAEHFWRGQDAPRAVRYCCQAAQNALQRPGYQEAIGHLTRGLDLLQTLPDTPTRRQYELTLLLDLGRSLVPTRGFAAPDVKHVYDRARELCQQVGETPQLFPVVFGLRTLAEVQGDLATSRVLGLQLLALAQGTHDPVFLLGAHQAVGITGFLRGDTAAAHTHLEQGLVLYSPLQHRTYVALYGEQDPGVSCHCFAAWALWVLGLPDQALGQIHAAWRLAQELAHPYVQVWALLMAIVIAQLRGEGAQAMAAAEAAVALATEQGFALLGVWATMFQGWVLAARGRQKEGMAQLRQGLTVTRAAGAECLRPWWLVLLAEVAGRVEQPETGLVLLAEAHDVMDTTGERFWDAERLRLQGVLLLQQTFPDVHQAETCFQQALAVARHQQARALELRAAMSLARLWRQQDKRREAHALLAPVYGWFTEGFDTADLQEARTLLKEIT